MTQSNENAFFATQIHQTDKDQQKITIQQKKEEPKVQKQELSPNRNHIPSQVQLRKLLQMFNSFDKQEKGLITDDQSIKIVKSFEHIVQPSTQKIENYFKLALLSNQKALTFDEFLFFFGLCQYDIDSKSIDEQYDYCKIADPRIIDFLRLLNSYRKKCEKQSVYQEAKKSKNKVQEVRQKQYKRRKNYLSIIHQKQLQSLQSQQKDKFAQFCQTWDDFMNQYEQTAAELVKKLGQKQQQDLKLFMQKTKEELASKVRFSKKVVQLQDFQRRLVKSQQYEKAEKIKAEIQQLKNSELQKKQKQDISTVELRAQTLRKQQASAMNTLLQKVQKDRNDQSKQRTSDSEKLIVKSKALVTQVKHRHTQALKRLYEALHNVTIDQNRLNMMKPSQRGRSSLTHGSTQRV